MSKDDDLEEIKRIVTKYNERQVHFSGHSLDKIARRESSKDELIKTLFNTSKLVYSYEEEGKYGERKHVLHFEISNTRTIIIPVVFSDDKLYIITFIMRYRKWQRKTMKR